MNIDLIIIISYLIITSIVGIYYSKSNENLGVYALGGKKFPTIILSTTIFATYASSSGLYILISKGYLDGAYYIFPILGQFISLYFSAYYLAPKIRNFENILSVSELMGKIYSQRIRVISTIPIFIMCAGYMAIQVRVVASTFSFFADIDNNISTILVTTILILYSAFGGVRAVTFTDFLQFITFTIALPVIFYNVIIDVDILRNFENRELFLDHFINLDNKKFSYYLTISAYFLIPTLSPPVIQRMLMARNNSQVRKSFINATNMYLIYSVIVVLMGSFIYVLNQNIDENNIIAYLIEKYSFPGIKGIFIISILAMAMSTADSFLNSSSVCFANDFCVPLKIIGKNKTLFISKLFSIFVGLFSIIIALLYNDLIEMILFVASFYAPIITIPLLLALLGFSFSEKSILSGMLFGVLTSILWSPLMNYLGVEDPLSNFLPSIFGHLFGLFIYVIIENKLRN